MARRLGNISRETIPLLILFVAQQKPSRGGLWHPILMQFYSGPLMQLLSGVDSQQSTRRAQDRESVSQALERVRRAARQGKKERFTTLLHHINPAMLRTAFYAMKRDAAPGVDSMTWDTYEKDLDRRIEDLHARVKTGAYRAQ